MYKLQGRIIILLVLALTLVFSACTNTPVTESENAGEVEETTPVENEAEETVAEEESEEVASAEEEVVETDEEVVVRFPLTSDPSTLEAGIANELYTGMVSLDLHIGLFTYNEDTELVPYAVSEYEVSEDGTVYTFHLHENIVWHNGRPLVADDYKTGWKRLLTPEVGAQDGGEALSIIVGASEFFNGEADDISGVEVVDDYTLKVTLTQPSLSFLDSLAVSAATWVVPSEAVNEGQPGWVGDPVGAGPFKFVEWQPNVKIVLEANPDFFLGKPEIDRVEYIIVPDTMTALSMFEAGELDMAGVPSSELPRIQEDADLSEMIHFWTRAQLQYFGMNQSMFEPFKDVRVRQAFNYAIDRTTLISAVLNDVIQPATGLVPPNIPQYNPDLEGYEYNPEKAQELLAEAGYPNGEGFPTLELATLSTTIAEAVAAQLTANLGITVEVLQPERGDMISGLWDHDRWQFFWFGWTATSPSAQIWVYEMLYSGLGSNFSTYSNAEVDELIDNAMNAVDFEIAKQNWQEAEMLAVEDAAMIPFGYSQYIYLVNSEFSGFKCNLFGPAGFANVTKTP